jgi:hypothetical protein
VATTLATPVPMFLTAFVTASGSLSRTANVASRMMPEPAPK